MYRSDNKFQVLESVQPFSYEQKKIFSTKQSPNSNDET